MSILKGPAGNIVKTATGAAITSAKNSAIQTAKSVVNSPQISVDGVASAVEGAVADVKGAIASSIGGSINNFVGGLASGFNDQLGGYLGGLLGGLGFDPGGNELNKFASYNYIFTLSALTNFELNFPDFSYRLFGPRIKILQSGGAPDKTRLLSEFFGPVEYFIDDVELVHVPSFNNKTKQTDAAAFEFSVQEPYSMGMFIETIKVAAKRAGHANHLTAPFCLSLEFVGYDDNGRVHRTRARHYPITLPQVSFSVTEGGSQYQVKAVPYNHIGFSDQNQNTKTDINITGRNVQEILQSGASSLAAVLNTRMLKLEQAKQIGKADQVVIMFPTERASLSTALLGIKETDKGAVQEGELRELPFEAERKQELFESLNGTESTEIDADFEAKLKETLGISIQRSAVGETIREYVQEEDNINHIGKAKVVVEPTGDGDQTNPGANDTNTEENPNEIDRKKVAHNDELRSFKFNANTKIQDIIEEVLIASEWGRGITERLENPDENGNVEWFKIESQVYAMADGNTVSATGAEPKVFVYRVIPYKVNAARFSSPTKAQPSLAATYLTRAREYNYIYTGQNQDILDFDIQFDNAYFLGVNSDRGQLNAGNKTKGQNGMTTDDKKNNVKLNEGDQGQTSGSGTKQVKDTTGPSTGGQGGGGSDTTEVQIARMFNDALVNSHADLIQVDLKIWGDPFYMSDSGMGNYNAAETGLFNFNANGQMDYQNGDVNVVLNFRTPQDIRNPGYMQFPGFGLLPVKSFSGLYRVNEVTSSFSGGEFTQVLKINRLINQEGDIKAIGSKGNNAVITAGEPENDLGDAT